MDDRAASIGLIAGWGRYPMVVAQRLKALGHPVVCLTVRDHADPLLTSVCDASRWIGVAQLGTAIRFFRMHGVTHATMAGKIHKTLLFQRWWMLRHLPDWTAVRTFFPHYVTRTQDRKDDTMLSAVTSAFARFGIRFQPATDFVPELLVGGGHLSGPRPGPGVWHDVAFGWRVARELGRVDVGQTVVVKGRAVLALEAVEGTDECIRRAGQLCPTGGFTVVKVAKPQQDMRFDVPTIGVGTLETIARAGGRALAIEAGRTILLDEPEVLRFARQHHISLVACSDSDVSRCAA